MSEIRRMMAVVIVLLMFLNLPAGAQCIDYKSVNDSSSVRGTSRGNHHYYRNLIIQDIALAGRASFQDIRLGYDYQLDYQVDTCNAPDLLLKINDLRITPHPVLYYGVDVSASLIPAGAELVFNVRNQYAIVMDSIRVQLSFHPRQSTFVEFFPLNADSSEKQISVDLSRLTFYYDKDTYDAFRDDLLQVDEYYAALAIADSAVRWVQQGFLAETAHKTELLLRQMELERILRFIDPVNFGQVSLTLSGHKDLPGTFHMLQRINTRYKTLSAFASTADDPFSTKAGRLKMIDQYLDWLDHYHRMGFYTDYRFVNFLEKLSRPVFTNSHLLYYLHKAEKVHTISPNNFQRTGCELFNELLRRGNDFEQSGTQTRALVYYEAALKLSRLIFDKSLREQAIIMVCRIKMEIISSYLGISARILERDNPALAVQYLNFARDVSLTNNLPCIDHDVVTGHELQMFRNFTGRVPVLLQQNEYHKAMAYLTEIRLLAAQSGSFQMPDGYDAWMRMAQQGIYDEMIRRIGNLVDQEEWGEAEQAFRLLSASQMASGGMIPKSNVEAVFESKFRQFRYDDFMEEGFRYMAREEYVIALYYFNKANQLSKQPLSKPDPNLVFYRQSAAIEIIGNLVSEINYRAMTGDYEGAKAMSDRVEEMKVEYFISDDHEVMTAFRQIREKILASGCDYALGVFQEMMNEVYRARDGKDYILALKWASDAVNYSMDHIECRIRDDQAWYQKVVLETAAAYQEMELNLRSLEAADVKTYTDAFRELRDYYYQVKLLDQGVPFVSLFDRVMASENVDFLAGMTGYYHDRGDFEQSLHILFRLKQLGYPSESAADDQRKVAASLARRDAHLPGGDRPWETLGAYQVKGRWFRTFNWQYKRTWLKEKKWRIADWPLIWKK